MMTPHVCRSGAARLLFTAAAALLMGAALGPAAHAAPQSREPLVALARADAMPRALRGAQPLGRMASTATLKLAIGLPWRDTAGLTDLVRRLYDPHDPQYRRFLSREAFQARFSPDQSDVDAVTAWARAGGLQVADVSPARNLVILSGSRDAVEAAFHVQLNRYRLPSGRVVFARSGVPSVPQSIAVRLRSVAGLTDIAQRRPTLRKPLARPLITNPTFSGSGPGGGVTPADIKSLYTLNDPSIGDGTGQTMALYELDGYDATDIAAYATAFGLTTPTLTNVLLDGVTGVPADPAFQSEVTLDLEMMTALAPAAKIIVYEADNTSTGSLAIFNKIADDDLAPVTSVSYGTPEVYADSSGERVMENDIFTRMAAQGQGVYVSSGDTGAYLDLSLTTTPDYQIAVSDPASQPMATAVGGTTLLGTGVSSTSTVAVYGGETTWNEGGLDSLIGPDAGGGGVSAYWAKPSYQAGVGYSTTLGTPMRDVPDVSLNADPYTGYSVYLASQGNLTLGTLTGFTIYGGTSASAPLWAAYSALVNQRLAALGSGTLGFANPSIYTVAESAAYANDFHDIADGSTNLKYPATTGFDDATGWGSFVGANLFAAFAPNLTVPQALTGTVLNAQGTPVSGATVVVTSPQISTTYAKHPAVDSTNGTFGLMVPSLITPPLSTTASPITYTLSADAPGYAGQSIANVAAPSAVTLTLRPPDHTYAISGSYQMIAAPYDYTSAGDFTALFGLTPPLTIGGIDLLTWAPDQTEYVAYPLAPADTLRLGQGYWAILPATPYIRRSGIPASTAQPYRIILQQGWNMVGDPFLSAVPIASIQVDTVTPGAPAAIGASPLVTLPFYAYTGGTAYQSLSTTDSLQPWQGYWIYATQPAALVVPPGS